MYQLVNFMLLIGTDSHVQFTFAKVGGGMEKLDRELTHMKSMEEASSCYLLVAA